MTAPVASLSDISAGFAAEVCEIEASFLASASCLHVRAYVVPYGPHGDGCVVSLWDAWNRFLRTLVLTSCAGTTISTSGVTYTPRTPRNEASVLAALKAGGVRMTEGEPSWYNPRILANIVSVLDAPNAGTIMAAIGASSVNLGPGRPLPNPIEQLWLTRNFVAHKTPRTFAKVSRYMNRPITDVHMFIWEKLAGGIERFTAWSHGLIAIADASCA